MHCLRQVTYAVRRGDNLYQLAKYYRTTVPQILALNPGTDPYNLQTGTELTICPGPDFQMPPDRKPSVRSDCKKKIALINSMRLAWEQHVYWTRMLIISIAERLKDEDVVAERLLQNPHDIANIFAGYYSKDVAGTISRLLTEHLQIGAALITDLRDGNTADADMLDHRWYVNADEMAKAFGDINPYYSEEEMRKMLYMHLDLTKQEVAMRLAGNYHADVKAFDEVEAEAMQMADAFTTGLIRQFPQMFS